MSHLDDYTAIRQGAIIGALSGRRQIAVSGTDRASYLQGLLTNDIQALAAGTGCYAAWLTPQGRMLTDLDVLESGDSILLDVPVEEAAATLTRLDQFLFSEDVQLASLENALTSVWVHGPDAAALLTAAAGGSLDAGTLGNYRLARGTYRDAPVVVARNDQLGVPGYAVYLPPAAGPELEQALRAGGAVVAGRAAIEAARIEAGYPLFGPDMTSDTIPLEAGIEDRAISLTKGCYVGQEVIIRVLHRGHGRVARRLVGLRAAAAVAPGSRIAAGEREIGFITSAGVSPRLGSIALGYVHRDFVTPGTDLTVRSGGEPVAATVTAVPME